MSAPLQLRRNNFNLLRLVFALLVLLSHAPELRDGNRSREILTLIFHTISFGEFAVDGFFLLSGYLIVQSWCSEPAILPFLKKRILRIYPGFIVASLVCAFVVGPIAAEPSGYFSQFWLTGFAKGMALLQSPVVPAVFAGTPYPNVNGAMWTIAIEFVCYLSVLMLGVLGAIRRRTIWLLVTTLVIALSCLQKMAYLNWADHIIRLNTFFFVGGCFYLYRERIRFNRTAAYITAVGLLVAMNSWRASEIALASFGAYLLFYAALKTNSLIAGFNKLPDVSYGVYLYGWPVQKLLVWYVPQVSPWSLFALSCMASVLLGTMSWYAVEKPFLRLKKHRQPGAAGTLRSQDGSR